MRFEVDGEELEPTDGSAPSVVIEGDAEELAGLCEALQEAIEHGEAGGKLLTSDGVDDLLIRRI